MIRPAEYVTDASHDRILRSQIPTNIPKKGRSKLNIAIFGCFVSEKVSFDDLSQYLRHSGAKQVEAGNLCV